MRALSLAEALKIIEGTFAAAKEHNCYALAAIVLDAGGRIKAFQKQDGASLMRFEIAYGKAFAALSLGRSSRMVLQKAKEKPLFVQSLERIADGPLFLEAGGATRSRRSRRNHGRYPSTLPRFFSQALEPLLIHSLASISDLKPQIISIWPLGC
jgi:uncharacterized protein GlcG (DUF336 family)